MKVVIREDGTVDIVADNNVTVVQKNVSVESVSDNVRITLIKLIGSQKIM